jgi:hypothetical protein
MSIKQRFESPTPGFFKKLQRLGLAVAAVGTTVIALPVALPALLTQVAGYCILAGGVAAAVSQVTTTGEDSDSSAQ